MAGLGPGCLPMVLEGERPASQRKAATPVLEPARRSTAEPPHRQVDWWVEHFQLREKTFHNPRSRTHHGRFPEEELTVDRNLPRTTLLLVGKPTRGRAVHKTGREKWEFL